MFGSDEPEKTSLCKLACAGAPTEWCIGLLYATMTFALWRFCNGIGALAYVNQPLQRWENHLRRVIRVFVRLVRAVDPDRAEAVPRRASDIPAV